MSEPRGPGRPREDGARRRTLTIRITEADRQLLGLAAERVGRPVSTAVRDAAIVWACDELGLDPEDHV